MFQSPGYPRWRPNPEIACNHDRSRGTDPYVARGKNNTISSVLLRRTQLLLRHFQFLHILCQNFPMDFTHQYVENLYKFSIRSQKNSTFFGVLRSRRRCTRRNRSVHRRQLEWCMIGMVIYQVMSNQNSITQYRNFRMTGLLVMIFLYRGGGSVRFEPEARGGSDISWPPLFQLLLPRYLLSSS